MDYVMVPVPEELADKVLTFVKWREAQANTADPAGEQHDYGVAVARAFERLDDASRTLVTVVAEAVLDGEGLSVPDVAARSGVSTREAVAILLEVNNVMASEGGPPLAFGGTGLGPSEGESVWDAQMITMVEALAGPILNLSRTSASA